MGKTLKRQMHEGGLGTPGAFRHGRREKVTSSKRHKQMSIVPFLQTPALAEETPILHGKPSARRGITNTGIAKLEQLNLRTRQKPLLPNASTDAPTQGRPTVDGVVQGPQPHSPSDSNGDFIISMSQTYERTQPDRCLDFGHASCEDIELSLRRTQQYHASHSGQLGSLQDHEELIAAVAAGAARQTDPGVAATATTTAAATEPPVPDTSTLADDIAAAFLPSDRGPAAPVAGASQASILPLTAPVTVVSAAEAATEAGSQGAGLLAPRQSLDFLRQPHVMLPAISTGPTVTPDMPGCSGRACGSTDVTDDGMTPPTQVGLPLFPIFQQGRPRRRPVFLVRHGESEYNVACMRRGGFGDPSDIFDARLTPKGEKQARGLRPQVLDLMQQHGDPLFVVSPLSRAIETFLHMLPHPERLKVPGPVAAPAPAGSVRQPTQAESAAGNGCGGALEAKPLNFIICPHLAEILLTTGDVGRPRSELMVSYPQVAEQLKSGLEQERWWYENPSKGPNCCTAKVLSSREPDRTAKARVDRFRHFLLSEPHRPIVVVGHANFFKHLTHDSCYMKNCQMVTWAL